MIYKEEVRDLFSVPDDYWFAQCISADFGMGKGIAVEFNKRYDMKNEVISFYLENSIDGSRDLTNAWDFARNQGFCLWVNRVFNLVTKRNYWSKPTYETLENSLRIMKQSVVQSPVKKIAMPQIGCGLDKLKWEKVSKIIQDVFKDTDIEILVCRQ
ncbi:MAG: macro domain-containing protein [Alphaproteobacteria bacterium]|nr:macro domain-containing protein [Alphaproteobacteria bacterium]